MKRAWKIAASSRLRSTASSRVRQQPCRPLILPRFTTFTRGEEGTASFRVAVKAVDPRTHERNARAVGQNGMASAWHDVPLSSGLDGANPLVLSYVNEVPRGTTAKMEMAAEEEGNPVRQDENADGSLRHFRYGPCPFNYGYLPQTFEDPESRWEGLAGDGDPIDVVEVSEHPMAVGEVGEVLVLGLLGLVDQGEMDWKVLAVNVENPWLRRPAGATRAVGADDITAGVCETVRDWFENYKTADGKPRNEFLPAPGGGVYFDAARAVEVVAEGHAAWLRHFEAGGGCSSSSLIRAADPSHPLRAATFTRDGAGLRFLELARASPFFLRPENQLVRSTASRVGRDLPAE